MGVTTKSRGARYVACLCHTLLVHNGSDSAAQRRQAWVRLRVTRACKDELNAAQRQAHPKIEKRDARVDGVSRVDNLRTREYLLDDVEKNLGQMFLNVLSVSLPFCGGRRSALTSLFVRSLTLSRTPY